MKPKVLISLLSLTLLFSVIIFISSFFLFPTHTPIIKTDWWKNNRYCEKICDFFGGSGGIIILKYRSQCHDFISCEQEMLPLGKHNRVDSCFINIGFLETGFQCPFTYQKGTNIY